MAQCGRTGASQSQFIVRSTPELFFHLALLINISTFNKRFGGQTELFFHLALLINISTFNKRFGGQTEGVS